MNAQNFGKMHGMMETFKKGKCEEKPTQCQPAPPVIFRIERGYTPQYANFLMRQAAPVLMKPAPAADLCLAVERQLPPSPAASSLAS